MKDPGGVSTQEHIYENPTGLFNGALKIVDVRGGASENTNLHDVLKTVPTKQTRGGVLRKFPPEQTFSLPFMTP